MGNGLIVFLSLRVSLMRREGSRITEDLRVVLTRHLSSIGHDVLTGDEGGLVRGEEVDSIGDVLGLSQLVERDQLEVVSDELLVFKQVAVNRGIDEAGEDSVRSDTELPKLDAKRPSESDQSRL